MFQVQSKIQHGHGADAGYEKDLGDVLDEESDEEDGEMDTSTNKEEDIHNILRDISLNFDEMLSLRK